MLGSNAKQNMALVEMRKYDIARLHLSISPLPAINWGHVLTKREPWGMACPYTIQDSEGELLTCSTTLRTTPSSSLVGYTSW